MTWRGGASGLEVRSPCVVSMRSREGRSPGCLHGVRRPACGVRALPSILNPRLAHLQGPQCLVKIEKQQ